MIRLIEQDEVQKKWAIVLQGNAPTIAAYQRNPQNYNALPHGLYEIECHINNFRDADNGFQVWPDGIVNSGLHVKVLVSHVQIIKYIASENLRYNGSMVYLKGRFDKRGSEILFILGSK